MDSLRLPKFENEAEEAQWWFDHREDVSAEFAKACASGTLGEGSVARRVRKLKEVENASRLGADDREASHS